MYPTGNSGFDAAALVAEATRQTAMAAAQSQADVTASDLAYYATLVAAATSNGISPAQFLTASQEILKRPG